MHCDFQYFGGLSSCNVSRTVHRQYGSDLCRLCLQKNDELVHIFVRNERNGVVIAQVISDLFQVVVSWGDKYPKFICKECYTKLMGFHRMKGKYPVHTLPSFVLFRNQSKIVNSAIDYAKKYNVSTPDFQHSPLSTHYESFVECTKWDHSPFSLELEELAAEAELKTRRVAVDNLLETVAQILKKISNEAEFLENQSVDVDEGDDELLDTLALPDSSFDVDIEVFSSVDTAPESVPSPIALDDNKTLSLAVDSVDYPESSSPIQEARRGFLRNREQRHQRDKAGRRCSEEFNVDKIKSEISPPSVPGPQLGRLPRKTKLKRITYRESSTSSSESEPENRWPNSERERESSYDCATCQTRHSSKEALNNHIWKEHLLKDCNSLTSVLSPQFGRLPRKTKFKRIRYQESSMSSNESEPEAHQPNDEKKRESSYDCAICQKRHSSKEALNNHIRKEHSLKDGYDEYSQDSDDSWAPERSTRGRKRFSFGSSSESADQSPPESGPTRGNDIDYFRCALCRKTFRRIDELREHVTKVHLGTGQGSSSVHGDAKVEVKGAERKKKRQPKREEDLLWGLLGVYVKSKEELKKPKSCIGCGLQCDGLEDLREHIMPGYCRREDAGTKGKRKKEKLSYQCCCCPKNFVYLFKLSMHIRITHRDAKPYACKFCGLAFKIEKYVKKHEVLHTGKKKIRCDECGKYFWDRNLLKLHSVVHATAKSHKCPECGKGFRGKHLLKIHQKIHNKEGYLRCPECPSMFAVKSDLSKHMARHSKVRNFECHVCLRRFLYKRNLNEHMHRHQKKKCMKVALFK